MTTSATLRKGPRAGSALARWQAWVGAAVVVGGMLVVTALPAAAEGTETSSVQITPDPAETGGSGSTTCAMAGAGSGSDAWQELRFTALPEIGGTATASAGGVSATLTRSGSGTASFVATSGVALAIVAAAPGQATGGARFRYDPPSRGASGLSGRDPASPIGSVLLCVAVTSTPTAGAETAVPPVAKPTIVRARTISRTPTRLAAGRATAAPAAPARAVATTPAIPRLPETGSATTTLVLAGLGLLGLGAVAAAASRVRRVAPDCRA